MVAPPLIVLRFLPTFMLDPWRYFCVDPVRRLCNARVGVTTIATIGASGGLLSLRYRPRHWRGSWGMLCLSVAFLVPAYYLLRRMLPGRTG
jgi:hypothetical protein